MIGTTTVVVFKVQFEGRHRLPVFVAERVTSLNGLVVQNPDAAAGTITSPQRGTRTSTTALPPTVTAMKRTKTTPITLFTSQQMTTVTDVVDQTATNVSTDMVLDDPEEE